MPHFVHGRDRCEALQLERMNAAGRPMFASALPPWFLDLTTRHHQEIGFLFWDGGQTYIRCEDRIVEINVDDWLVRRPDGTLKVYQADAFVVEFREIPEGDPAEL